MNCISKFILISKTNYSKLIIFSWQYTFISCFIPKTIDRINSFFVKKFYYLSIKFSGINENETSHLRKLGFEFLFLAKISPLPVQSAIV